MKFKSILKDTALNDALLQPVIQEEKALLTEENGETLYQKYLPIFVERIKHSEIYPALRDRETSLEEANDLVHSEMISVIGSMNAEHPEIYQKYVSDEHFRQSMVDDIVGRTYEDIADNSSHALDFKVSQDQHAEEISLLNNILHSLKINDINISWDDNLGVITADDGDNFWVGKDLYDFLINETIVYEDEQPLGIKQEDYQKLLDYASQFSSHKTHDSRSKELYIALKQLSSRILDGTSVHLVFMTNSDFDHPLTIYYDKDVNVLEIYHTYEIEAIEVMEPYMKMKLDVSSKTLIPFYYENPVKKYQLGIEQPSDKRYDEQTTNELYSYALTWIQNIKEKGYRIESEQILKNKDKIGVYFIDYHLDGTIKYTDMPIQELQKFINQYGHDLSDDIVIDQIDMPNDTKIFTEEKTESTNNNIEKIDHHIHDDNLGAGTAKERYKNNVTAIRLLFLLEKENRLATKDEQEVLSKYVGWGGLSEVFDETKNSWSKEYAELKQLLNDEEYRAARESTLTAFYTSPIVIKSIYEVLYNLGFRTGNVLEPSCGIGNFFGMIPDTMNAKCYGVELDSITGRIAKQLYQKANIAVEGYEKTNLPDSFFDVAIGNVPFGQFKVLDKRYDKYNFHIHDYFFAKTIDKIRPGGIIAFITSRYTMDKSNGSIRRYINERAELLGAIRLPNTAFKDAANTLVTSDILILKKRERPVMKEDEWVFTGTDAHGNVMNRYFVDHPEMILGTVELTRNMYGREDITVTPYPNRTLKECLDEAVTHIQGQIDDVVILDDTLDIEEEVITVPADPNVRNFSYTIVDGAVYFRENSIMSKLELSKTAKNRVMGMIEIRDCLRRLIEYQKDDYPDEIIQTEQQKLNVLYDAYTKEYGLINQRANAIVFREDSGYYLLCSLENLNEDGTLKSKADIFTKRTIRAKQEINHADNANEALLLSLSERGSIDFDYMEQLSGINKEQLISDLEGVIYKVPNVLESETKADVYVTADEYLSGDIKEKLDIAKLSAKIDPSFEYHVQQLEKAMPKPLTAAEIEVRLGATWIPPNVYEDFMHGLLNMSYYAQDHIHIVYANDAWFITHKTWDRQNIKSEKTYGTSRANAYRLIEESLNLKSIKIFDYEIDEDGKKKAVLNKRDTMIAQQKQDSIKEKFHDWIWKDFNRREQLVKLYNDTFNTFRPREYDGSHLTFPNMNSEITLKKHQKDAVAHVLYGNNVLLAHVVGAGKTFEMVAACMELKRLGLSQKAMFVVPNHLIEQWGSDFLQLYPSANILVTKNQDFEKSKRKKFCSRIATGDYDAIIIGHSMFEKIPVSVERQRHFITKQIEDITRGIKELEEKNGERHSIKQLEKTKKSLSARLESLNDDSKKDDVITFEELGIDRLFVDESHNYKNLFLYTKMRNVAGLSTQEAKKSSDMFMKCQYLSELNGGKGIVFATGTPISNSMTEMYTIQRYLQYDSLAKRGLEHFDSWASTFGETVTAIELAPEGTGYQMKTRFARFYNLPELVSLFKDVANIKTADMLNLPVPNAHYVPVAVKPSEIQKEIISTLADRAQAVRDGAVDPHIDNMLKITNDGRKLAMDQRLLDPNLPEFEDSKVNTCIKNVLDIYKRTEQEHLTQLVFCDISTPKNSLNDLYERMEKQSVDEEAFIEFTNIYDEVTMKLIKSGVSKDEIAYIHDANTDAKKKKLFAKVREGKIRVLLGSTQKMGAGTNVQTRLIAIHDLDCPWRPSDLEQRAGRIVRQGNQNSDVYIYRYVTEQTFDAYLYQIVENKQKFISQIMTSKIPVRCAEDFDEASLSYAEIKALASGNPMIKEKMDLDNEVKKLRIAQANYQSERYEIENRIYNYYPNLIKSLSRKIEGYQKDIQTTPEVSEFCGMTINDVFYDTKEAAGNALLLACKSIKTTSEVSIGKYKNFSMWLSYDVDQKSYEMTLMKTASYKTLLGDDVFGNIQRLDNLITSIPKKLEVEKQLLKDMQTQLENAKEELGKPFEKEEELKAKTKRLSEVNKQLDIGNKKEHDADFIDTGDEPNEIKRKERTR